MPRLKSLSLFFFFFTYNSKHVVIVNYVVVTDQCIDHSGLHLKKVVVIGRRVESVFTYPQHMV